MGVGLPKYSISSLARNARNYHQDWGKMWRAPKPKKQYDVVIVGGGAHGLATAYYLAKNHGITNVAVLEKGWLGGGNTGRNTTIIRSNYLYDESAKIFELAVRLYEGLSQDFNYNIMFSQRHVINVALSIHEQQEEHRRVSAIRGNGIDSELLTVAQVQHYLPHLNMNGRFPVFGGLIQKRGGTARHDAVAWGFARGADAMGVDIIQNCEVAGFDITGGVVQGVNTNLGKIKAKKIGVVVAGHCSVLADMAGFRLPIESFPLQAYVSEPIKPIFNHVIMCGGGAHAYMSQSDKGELVVGAGTDIYPSYSQRGGFDIIEDTVASVQELFPFTSRLRMLRQWGGIVDVTYDRSPIISKTPIENLFFNCGWGTGGFKATPGSGHCFAASIAAGELNDVAAPFSLKRFSSGAMVDEGAASGVAH